MSRKEITKEFCLEKLFGVPYPEGFRIFEPQGLDFLHFQTLSFSYIIS